MHTRRAALGALAGACTVTLAGCSLLEDPLDRAADPAAVEESVAASTGFEQDSLTEQVYEETVEVSDQTQQLQLTNWTNRYTMAVPGVDLDAARLLLFTTPTVTVANRSANPFAGFDRAALIRAMVERIDTGPVAEIQQVGERQVTVLDDPVTVDEFDAETEQEGVRLRLHVADHTNDGDLLVLFGFHPDVLDLTGDVDTLTEGIVHPARQP